MPEFPQERARPSHDRTVARGAVVQVLGSLGKLLVPVFFLVATRLFGPEIVGLYLAAFKVVDVGISLTVSGFNTAVLMFASRFADNAEEEERLYTMMANAVFVTASICVVLIGLAHTAGPELLRDSFPHPAIGSAVVLLSWTIPLQAVSSLVVAATKSTLTMKWDAIINGFLHPSTMLVAAVGAWLVSPTLEALLWGHLIAKAVVAVFSALVFARMFSVRRLVERIVRPRWFRGLFAFAIPQNLNMTFNTFITNVDIVMLGAFGTEPAKLAFYGIAAELVRNIRQVKVALAASFAPVIARLHSAGDIEGLTRLFGKVSRWSLTLGIGIALVVATLRTDLLLLFHDTFDGDNHFMLILVATPLLSCAWGVAGNIVVMTGHSMYNLLNSTTVAGLNALLNYLLIPIYGLYGAAIATLCASLIVAAMQLVEARLLVGVRAPTAVLAKPLIALLPATALVVAWEVFGLTDEWWLRLAGCVLALGAYILTLLLLKLDPEDVAMVRSRLHREPAA